MLGAIGQILTYFAEFFALFMGVFYLLTFIENKDRIDEPLKIEEYPSVTIIIPAYDEEKNIAATIESAAKLDYPAEKLRILVMDDGSKDKTLEVSRLEAAKYSDKNIRVVGSPHSGKAKVMNTALKMIDTEFMATLDSDSSVAPDSLKNMMPYFFKNDRVAAVVAAMKIRNPKTFLQKIQSTEYLVCFCIKKMTSFANGLIVTPGPLSAYRMSIFKEIGGFDEHSLTEDGEIALRIQKNQYIIEYCHNAEVLTNAPATLKALKNQRVRWNRGTLRNFAKYKELFGDPKYGDFGLLFFPSPIIFLIIAFDMFLIVSGSFIFTTLKKIEYGTLIHLPKIAFNGGFHFDAFFFQPTAAQIVAFTIFALSLVSFYFIYKYSQKDFKTMTLFYIPYLLIYYPLFIIGFWLITIFYELTNKKLSWYK